MNHIIWQFQSWVYNQRIESRPQKDICIPIYITALFKIAQRGSNPNVYQKMNGFFKKMWYVMEYYSAFYKEGTFTRIQHDEP